MQVVTITSRRKLRNANALGRSLLENNPGASFRICVIDGLDSENKEFAEFEIIPTKDLGLQESEFLRLALMLDEDDFCFALQPWILEKVLAEGHPRAIFLAPEIYVYGNLSDLMATNHTSSVSLTPNLLKPLGSDTLRPTETEMLNLGVFQSGFMAVGPDSRDFLSWLKERFKADTPNLNLDAEFLPLQRWLDLVPGLWVTDIVRDPGYNVGFWNISQLELLQRDRRITVDGRPLRFFNFSGFEPSSPWILSPQIGDEARSWPSQNQTLSKLCEDYATCVESPTGYSHKIPYGFDTLEGYGKVTKITRNTFRNLVAETNNLVPSSIPTPFSGSDSLVIDFITRQIPGSHLINRPMMAVWKQREDLQRAFPDPLNTDGEGFLKWAWTSGIQEGDFKKEDLVPPTQDLEETSREPLDVPNESLGVNLVGYFTSELGMGELARIVQSTLNHAGISVRTIISERNQSRKSIPSMGTTQNRINPLNLVVLNADQMKNWKTIMQFSEINALPTIGIWAWELEDFPSGFEDVFNMVEEIWTISKFSQEAIQKATEKPVFVLPLTPKPVNDLTYGPPEIRDLKLTGMNYFLAMFDYQSSMERKNPIGVVKAFRLAFQGDKSVNLVIKTINANLWPTQRERLKYECRNDENIIVVDTYLSSDEVSGLIQNAVAYVSLHRSEGYGLTCAESMGLGTPVIATGYSGNLDFMNAENSLLVDFDLVKVNDPSGAYTIQSVWAEPRVESAAFLMRKVLSDKTWAAKIGRAGQASMERIRSDQMDTEFVKARLSLAQSKRQLREAEERAAEERAAEERAAEERAAELVAEQLRRSRSFKGRVSSLIPIKVKEWINEVIST